MGIEEGTEKGAASNQGSPNNIQCDAAQATHTTQRRPAPRAPRAARVHHTRKQFPYRFRALFGVHLVI